jgi:hypothetical protein
MRVSLTSRTSNQLLVVRCPWLHGYRVQDVWGRLLGRLRQRIEFSEFSWFYWLNWFDWLT